MTGRRLRTGGIGTDIVQAIVLNQVLSTTDKYLDVYHVHHCTKEENHSY